MSVAGYAGSEALDAKDVASHAIMARYCEPSVTIGNSVVLSSGCGKSPDTRYDTTLGARGGGLLAAGCALAGNAE